jgi:serine/threonine protein kinase
VETLSAAQWQRVKEITADALEREPAAWPDLVEQACAGDAAVRREVLRLLAVSESSTPDFLATPPLDLHKLLPQQRPARFAVGQEVAGRFRIERFLGQGGMGEVYAALDLELQEPMALKTIRPAIASPSAIERFKREVKESRRIAHPCVCRVYDLFAEEIQGGEPQWFLTMELLEGQTLQDALAAGGPIQAREALPLIEDMASALSAAHAIGIVHRDFKPGNVMLVKRGGRRRAVVTDFGLALDLSREEATRPAADGTPAYMAPEQSAGGRIGVAADQFALGLVICQMLAGTQPQLDRGSEEESRRQLETWLQAWRSHLNPRARRVIRRCLEFRPERRFPEIAEVGAVLTGFRRRSRRRWWAAVAASWIFTAAIAVAISKPGEGPEVKDSVRVTPSTGLSHSPTISRDGKWIAYSSDRGQPGNLDIYIQPAAGGPARRLTTDPADEVEAEISPDNRLVAYRSHRNGGGVYMVRFDGTGERLVAEGGWHPRFSPDGRQIAFWRGDYDDTAPSAAVYVVPAEGGEPRRLAADFADARYPTWDSTGRFLLFEGCKGSTAPLSTCSEWWVMRADGTEPRNTGALAWIKSQKIEMTLPETKVWWGDQVVFSGAQGTSLSALWSLRLPAATLHPVGAPRAITPGDAGEREVGISEGGSIVYVRIISAMHVWRIPLEPGGGSGSRVTDDPSLDGCPSLSRDGKRLYFTRRIEGVRQVLVRDIPSGRESPVFVSADNKFWPISSADGSRAVVEVRRETESSIWLIGEGGQPRQLCSGCSHPTSWFGDKAVFYTGANGEIALLDVATGESRLALAPEPGMVLGGADWNASNQHLLFTNGHQAEAKQVFAVRFPAGALSPAGPRIPLTDEAAGAALPHWSPDGRAFYFLSVRDTYPCLWKLPFPAGGHERPQPTAVAHYHDPRISPDRANSANRGIAVAEDALFPTIGEVYAAVWLGRLSQPGILSLWGRLSFGR